MAKKTSFLMPPSPVRMFRQSDKNRHFYNVCSMINNYALQWNESFEWRENMMNEYGKRFGFPVKVKSFWQKLFS